jgi:hypothetical protein
LASETRVRAETALGGSSKYGSLTVGLDGPLLPPPPAAYLPLTAGTGMRFRGAGSTGFATGGSAGC